MSPKRRPIAPTTAATGWCDPLVPEKVRKSIAAAPMRFIQAAAVQPVKISRETLVLQAELPLGGESRLVAVKQFRPQGLWKAAAGLFRRSKAARNWAKAEFLLAHGIATPRPLLTCRLPLCGKASFGSSLLVSEWIIGGENLHVFAWRIAEQTLHARLRAASACADSLGRLLGRLHAAGAVHRDLKAANLLVVQQGPETKTWLVDLDGLEIGRRINLARQARDLGRLAAGLVVHPWVTTSICRRFLRAYRREFPLAASDWKTLWRAIAARVDEIVRRKRGRGEEVL